MGRKGRYSGRKEQGQTIELIDRLRQFERFNQVIAPELREMVLSGANPEEIFEKFKAMAAARLVTTALTDPDPGKAMAAIKDIIDRTQGKPTERKEVTHKLSKLKDEELDALLESSLEDLDESEPKGKA